MLAPYAGDVLVEHDVTFELYRQVWEARPDRHAGIIGAGSDSKRNGSGAIAEWLSCRNRIARCSISRTSLSSRTVWTSRGSRRKWSAPANGCCSSGRSGISRTSSRIDFSSNRSGQCCANVRRRSHSPWSRAPIRCFTGASTPASLRIPQDDRIRLLEFVSDVRPLYVEANLAIVPTLVSAGTNLKVLEAMAMDRAVVSTSSGCAGLGLEHWVNVWIADPPEDFARGIQTLLQMHDLRRRIAAAGRAHVERNYGWRQIGARQRALLRELMPPRVQIRPAEERDLPEIAAIQQTAPESSQWQAQDYLAFDCQVAAGGQIAGFLVSRSVADKEREILNIAIHPDFRRLHIATELLRAELARWPGAHFLEVRESNAAARRLYEGLGFQAVG